MSYDVFVVKNPMNGYTARLLAWPSLIAHGDTRTDALGKVRDALAMLWTEGEIVQIDLPLPAPQTAQNPWLTNFGRFKDDPTFDDLLDEIKSYRQFLGTEGEIE